MPTTSKANDFNLIGTDDKKYSLKNFLNKKALVIIFSCNHCPYVQAYENRLIEIQENYQEKEIQIICINSNNSDEYPEDSFENMKQRAQEKKFNFPYLYDPTQKTAHQYGATHTPQVFLFDEFLNLRYTGKIDDDWKNPQNVKRQFLREALNSILENKIPLETETYAIGCSIKWKK